MKYFKKNSFFVSILFSSFIIVISGCSGQKVNVKDLLNQPIKEAGNFNQSKKFIKAGITVVYLTGTPYEIGFAQGKLCKDEIINVNKIYWDYYDYLNKEHDGKWLPLSRDLERFIPEEYILESKGIADGSGIEYDKILFLNNDPNELQRQINMEPIKNRKIIVAVAPVGKVIEPPSINPLTPEDLAREVIDCTRAGASFVHLHVRDDKGNQTEDLTQFSRTLDLIRNDSDIIIQGSTGGLSELSLEERCVALNDPRVEVASLNMGSVNFSEEVYINRLPDIRYWARRMEETNVTPELVIFEAGMLTAVAKLLEEKVLKAPLAFGFCLGFHWALPADPNSLFFLKSSLTEPAPWGVVHDSMQDFSLLATAIGMGAAAIRVGFEDSVYYAPGKAAATNVVLVEKIVSLVHQIGYEVATPAEARELMGLKKMTT